MAIYKNDNFTNVITPHLDIQVNLCDFISSTSTAIGDLCAAECTFNGTTILLISVYISPNSTVREIITFLHRVLLEYTPEGSRLINDEINLHMIPMIITGDFNINFSSEDAQPLLNFMEEKLLLHMINSKDEGTTRYGTTLDAVFARHIQNIHSKLYISYFSYHKPIITTVKLE